MKYSITNLGRFNMEKLDSILKKIIIFLLITGLTFLMLDISFTELETVRSEKINKEQALSSLKKQALQLEKEIEDLEEPAMIEKILRREGYGKEGEIIYIVKVPEPVPPLSEIFVKDNEISLVEKFINFITGRNEK